jgi:hypothetical protein
MAKPKEGKKPAAEKPATSALQVVDRPVESLIPYVNNARTHSPEQVAQIAAAIREFGFTNPILIDPDGGIVAGHGRLLAARQLEMSSVPTITLANLTPLQRRAYVVADNKLALNAGWDVDLLKIELGTLMEADYDATLTGFDADEIADMLLDEDGSKDSGDGGEAVLAYNLVFESEDQQNRWFDFVRHLRNTEQGETIAERLDAFIAKLDLS